VNALSYACEDISSLKDLKMAHETMHEPLESLSSDTLDIHRAISSLMEEFEAVDWYQQRADACNDLQLKKVLEHNRDEEIEHAAMVLEWLRRKMPRLDKELREYLFKDGSITGHEAEAMGRE